MTEPTDAELWQLYMQQPGQHKDQIDFARAVLAKWGHPAQAAEPVAWRVHPFDYGIGHEGVYAMTMREEQREAWRRKGWNPEPLFAAPKPVAREPLTDEQIQNLLLCGNPTDEEMRLIRIGWDAAHGIGIKKENGNG